MSKYSFGRCLYCGKEAALKDSKCVECGAKLPAGTENFVNLFGDGEDNPFADLLGKGFGKVQNEKD